MRDDFGKVSPSLEGLSGCRIYKSCHFRRTWSAWGGVSRGLDRQERRREWVGGEMREVMQSRPASHLGPWMWLCIIVILTRDLADRPRVLPL